MSEVIKDIVNKLVAGLHDMAQDIGELSVVTTTGQIITKEVNRANEEGMKTVYDIEETGVSAKTLIQIDGDIIVRVPVKDIDGNPVEIDERMLKLHEENVKIAMENWRTVITTTVSVVKELREFIT
ncbi:hypothetical protein GF319_04065 [Candidatus Bathyarchaeota archaeon]|nr:hypothetical protein [Candidatus Bathyarchaeota archaeon]